MSLAVADYWVIALYLLAALAIGLALRKKAGKSLENFFTGGKNMPWWLAGVSMVATTFAADTPLAVTEMVAEDGIAGNWLWWNMLIGGMLTTFFFARYWRRTGVTTDLELIGIRYSGPAARFLRGFKAVYLGLLMNAVIIGWVNLALMTLLEIFLGVPEGQQIYYVGGAMVVVAFYSSLSGLLGVAVTDALQFTLAMIGTVWLAFLAVNSPEIGGMPALKSQLHDSALRFFPQVGSQEGTGQSDVLSLGFWSFVAYVGFFWWASWYPGNEPGGGGYVAQRMFSAKNERHSFLATLFFQLAHYCLRPWPWIVVALCSLVLYPDLADPREGYVMVMKDFLPAGVRGLLLVAFLAAYMSTVSTQLNWGASYLINDLYLRERRNSQPARPVMMGRWATLLIMGVALLLTTQMSSIKAVWEFVFQCGAGLGGVLILRWYWWRINAWSEITATVAPFLVYGFFKAMQGGQPEVAFWQFPFSYLVTVLVTTLAWVLVTFLTPPTDRQVLRQFFDHVKPLGAWGAVAGQNRWGPLGALALAWLAAVLGAYSALFGIGSLVFGEWHEGGLWMAAALVLGYAAVRMVQRHTRQTR